MRDFSNQAPIFELLTERELEILRLLSDGFSNQEVAQELVISVGTVKWHNRQIYSKLYVNSRAKAIAKAQEYGLLDLESDTTATTINPPKHNLPTQITSFIGRKHQIDEIKILLQTSHLVTITGPGGTGKTRLALQVAADLTHVYPAGVYFVSLASLSDPTLVASAIADVLNIPETPNQPLNQTLKSYFLNQHMLLVLDNFEHVLAAAPLVSELLETSSNLRVLATSREMLQLYGEQEYVLSPLALPDASHQDNIATLLECESVALFVQRARRVRPDFEVTEDNANIIAEICTKLDGLPLVIELAAARCKLLTPEAMLARLESRLNLLTGKMRDLPTRQQTLRNTLDWSYDLLDKDEKVLFARLAVFRGGRTLEAIEAVCNDNLTIDVFDGLASLVDKSLIQQIEGHDSEPRFWMLETIHEYAWEQLEANREADTLRRLHAEYFVSFGRRAEPELRLSRRVQWVRKLEADYDNLRAAIEWCLMGDYPEQGARLIGHLNEFWFQRWQSISWREGLRWSKLAQKRHNEISNAAYSQVLLSGAEMSFHGGNYDDARDMSNETLILFREADDNYNVALTLRLLAVIAHQTQPNEVEKAQSLMQESLTLFREQDETYQVALTVMLLGESARMHGDYEWAVQCYEESLLLYDKVGGFTNSILSNLAFVLLHQGNYKQAQSLFEEALAHLQQLNNRHFIAVVLIGFAGLAEVKEQLKRAAHLIGAADIIFEVLGAPVIFGDKKDYKRIVANVQNQMDAKDYEEARAKGQMMTIEEAVAYALDDTI